MWETHVQQDGSRGALLEAEQGVPRGLPDHHWTPLGAPGAHVRIPIVQGVLTPTEWKASWDCPGLLCGCVCDFGTEQIPILPAAVGLWSRADKKPSMFPERR